MDAYNTLQRQLTQALITRQALRQQDNVMSRYWYEAEAAFVGQLCYRAEEWFPEERLQELQRTTGLDEQEWSAYKVSFVRDHLNLHAQA